MKNGMITEAMVSAGERVVCEDIGVCNIGSDIAREVVIAVFKAMRSAQNVDDEVFCADVRCVE